MKQELLTRLGIKVTKQRKVIVAILEKSKDPITAEEIYSRIEVEEGINFSTVYRTLNTLVEKGALIKTGMPGEKVYFQLRSHQHAHELECLACHKHIIIDECPLESFSRVLNRETGFVVTEHQLQLKGLCADCANPSHKSV